MSRTIICLFTALIVISGCASHEDREPKEDFQTIISSTGKRFFSYTVSMPRPDKKKMRPPPGSVRPSTQPHDGHPRAEVQTWMKTKLYTMLQEKLEETGYCPNGYATHDVRLGHQSVIEGECVEPDS